jgi:hypothetical protein
VGQVEVVTHGLVAVAEALVHKEVLALEEMVNLLYFLDLL